MNSIAKKSAKSAQSSSCITYPANSKFVMIRDCYVDICQFLNSGTGKRVAILDAAGKTESFTTDGEVAIDIIRCAAALLNYFEHWTNSKLVMLDQAQYSGEEVDLWIWGMSAKRIEGEMMGVFSSKSIASALDWLVEKSLLDRRFNEKNKLDKSSQYLFNIPLTQELINKSELKEAETCMVVDSPSRVNGNTLQGESICPPGKTYKNPFLEPLTESLKVSHVKRFSENAARVSENENNASLDQPFQNEDLVSNAGQSTSYQGGSVDQSEKLDIGCGFSLKKEKYSDGGKKAASRRSSFDEEGWYQMPSDKKYTLPRAIATRRMQYLLAFGFIEDNASPVWTADGLQIHTRGNQILVDSKDYENEPEDEAFHKNEGGMSLKQLRSYATAMEGMDQNWFNWVLEKLFEDSVEWCKKNGKNATKIMAEKSLFFIFGIQDFSDFDLYINGYEGVYPESRLTA